MSGPTLFIKLLRLWIPDYYDLPATDKCFESWANRRKDVRLVAEVVCDRKGANHSQQGRWSCSKLVTCDSKSFGITNDRTIGRRQQRLMVRSVARCYDWSCDRSLYPTIDCTICVPILIVGSVTGYHECSYDRSQYATIARTIGRRTQRSMYRTIGHRTSQFIIHQSLIATTSRTISCDGSCHRYSPIVRSTNDRTIGRRQQRLMVRSVARCYDWSCDRSLYPTIDCTICVRVPRLIVGSVTGYHECSYDRPQYATIASTIGRRTQRSMYRTIGHRTSRFIIHQSLIANTSRTISCDGSCHRYSPIVRDSATTRRDGSRYATAAGDRIKNCRSVAPWPSRNQSYDPDIARSGVTVG